MAKAGALSALWGVSGVGVVWMTGCQALDRPAGIVKRPEPVIVKPSVLDDPLPRATQRPDEPVVPAGFESLRHGEVLAQQGLKDQALIAFERAIAENPELTIAYLGAGDIYEERGDFASAQRRYESAANLAPGEFRPNYKNGLMLQLLGRFGEAVQAYLKALAVNPLDFEANLNTATAYLQLGEPKQAVIFAEKAVQINGQSGPARINLAAIYESLDRYSDAVSEYQQAAELTELTPELLLNLARALGNTGRYEEMGNTLRQVLKSQPSAAAHERMGFASYRLGRIDDAIESFRESLKLNPDYYPALNGVGVCLLRRWYDSGLADEQIRRDGIRALKRSLQLERDQPRILEIVTSYQ